MTKREGDKVTRSGIMMTGSGVQPTVTWGIVAEQMGFKRASEDLKRRAVNPEAGKAAMQWVLDLFDKHKVSTRDVTDRYKAFGTGQGSIFWTGPWTLNGYLEQKLPLPYRSCSPKSARSASPISRWAASSSTRRRTRAATRPRMDAVKWLSDNSFLWTTVGRGAIAAQVDPRTRPTTRPPGIPGRCAAPSSTAWHCDRHRRDPVIAGPTSPSIAAATSWPRRLRRVWAGQTSIDDAMAQLQEAAGRRLSTRVERFRRAMLAAHPRQGWAASQLPVAIGRSRMAHVMAKMINSPCGPPRHNAAAAIGVSGIGRYHA